MQKEMDALARSPLCRAALLDSRSCTLHAVSSHRALPSLLPLAQDSDVVKVVLLLTGSVEGMKAQTVEYLSELARLVAQTQRGCSHVSWSLHTAGRGCHSRRIYEVGERLWRRPHKRTHSCACTLIPRLARPARPAETFGQYEFLWRTDLQAEYEAFMRSSPTLEDCEAQLKRIMAVEQVGGCAA